MRHWTMALSILLAACSGPTIDDKDGSNGTDDGSDDSDVTDADTETEPPPTLIHHVVKTAAIAASTKGVDLDDDGTVDNAIGFFGLLVNDSIDATLASSSTVAIVQLINIDDFANDEGALGIFAAEDTDEDPSDNFSGTESFDGGSEVDADGVAKLNAEITITDHGYTAVLPPQTLTFGGYSLVASTPIYVVGEAYAPNNRGLIALGIDKEALKAELEKNGYGDYAGAIDSLADLDTDGNGKMDAVSAALSFGTTTCEVAPAN